MTKANDVRYDESHIKTLSSLEHIRTRPGMYVGRLGNGEHPDDGIYLLLKEVIDNSVDEFIMKQGRRIEVTLSPDGTAAVRDYGRGIPLGKLAECVSQINTGGKYNTEAFQYSVGLNGVGLKAVNALADHFTVRSMRDGRFRVVAFANGIMEADSEGASDEPAGTHVSFIPSAEHFPGFRFEDKFVRRRLQNYAYLNSGLSLYLNGERFYSRDGILDLLREKVNEEMLYDIISHKEEFLEFAFCHTNSFGETYYSFVNGQYTNDGGTHESAFREGILKGVNDVAGRTLDADDVRNGVVGAVALKLKDPVFESQTKNKLGNTEIRAEIVAKVKDVVARYLYQNHEVREKLLAKIEQNEKVRKEIQLVKKEAKENARKASFKIPKLRDCRYHLSDDVPTHGRKAKEWRGGESMVFLTEGQSASGSMISCRDVETQAIFSLKGKPLNCHGHLRKTMYSNEELYFIMRALGIEDGLEGLRYSKVIIATDADVDGMHIRNLLVTFFLTFFEQLALSEHLFILETPLFRVRNKRDTVYCYDARERDQACAKLGRACEVTRFKGLGEISPHEFGQFIGNDIRLLKVTVENQRTVPSMLEFFMGKNTPERRSYIMQNLV
jgi:DNA gyrase/topoisomerase IV subunit B